ncbi:MAG TPA: TetR/AcrR family transcriptional regulator [Symbiobacteriaceae bacterium]|nr:TetR/AcrR family transcriptional regulator [Symbiobacteriaceae bacterium]
MRTTKAQQEELRAALIQTGLRLFAEKGFAATTVDEITTAAGVAKGTFYNYFKTKEDLALAGTLAVQAEWSGMVNRLMTEARNTRERLNMVFAGASDWVQSNREVTWVWCIERLRRGREATGGPSGFGRLLTGVYRAGQAQGEVRRDRQPELLALEMEGMFLAYVASWHHSEGAFDLGAAMRKAVETNLEGTLAHR